MKEEISREEQIYQEHRDTAAEMDKAKLRYDEVMAKATEESSSSQQNGMYYRALKEYMGVLRERARQAIADGDKDLALELLLSVPELPDPSSPQSQTVKGRASERPQRSAIDLESHLHGDLTTDIDRNLRYKNISRSDND